MSTRIITLLLIALPMLSIAQDIEKQLLAEINRARANPAAYGEEIGVEIDYPPIHPWEYSKKLSRQCAKYAKELVKLGKLRHYKYPNPNESLAIAPAEKYVIELLILDEGVPSLGHRRHLLKFEHTKAGIGIAYGKYKKYEVVYVVIRSED